MQADESKVAALESIFGGQDITASVIRTVLTSNDNKFDEAVDSLLSMTGEKDRNQAQVAKPARIEEPENEQELLNKKESEKLKTLQGMFGGDLTQSVICTVLESNKGELVDAVDTLLNMTSKEINPTYNTEDQRELERVRTEEELKSYDDFKKLQLALQEEEERAIKEQQHKREQDLLSEERKHKELVLEQERMLKTFEAQRQADHAAKERALKAASDARLAEERAAEDARKGRELEDAQEKLRKAWEEKLKLLNAEEEKVRQLQAKQQADEEARRNELLAREKAFAAQEQELQKARAAEEAKLAERKARLEAAEAAKTEELARLRREASQREEERRKAEEQQRSELEHRLRVEAEERAYKLRVEEEERAYARKLEEERAEHLKKRMEAKRLVLQKEKAMLEAQRTELEAQRTELEAQRTEQERVAREAAKVEEEEARRKVEEENLRRIEAQQRAEEAYKQEQEKARLAEEARLCEEEVRNRVLQEEADRQQAAQEEERRKFDQMAASTVFIPPKSEATTEHIKITAVASAPDAVTTEWDLPEGNATNTNWLGLYPVRALPDTNKYVQFVYTHGAHSGTHTFKNVTPGHYEVRFFAHTRVYAHLARSATPVRVGPTPTLCAQLQGGDLLVHYTLDPLSAAPTREWVGVYEKDQRRNKKYLVSAYGNAEGQVLIKAPRTPGAYEVRLFAAGSAYNEQAKCDFLVEDNDTVLIEPNTVPAGSSVSVSWVVRTVEPSSGDWLGVYRADEPNNSNYLSCTYTQGASVGSASVVVPKEAGVYEVRLFARARGRYVTFRTSPPLTVV